MKTLFAILTSLFFIIVISTPLHVSASEIIIKSADKKSDAPTIIKEDATGSVLLKDDDIVLFKKRNKGSKFRAFDDDKKRWKSISLPRETNIKDWSIGYQIIPLKKKNEALALYISNTNPDIMYMNVWDGKRWDNTKEIALSSTCVDGRFGKPQKVGGNIFLQIDCNYNEEESSIQLLSIDKNSLEIIDSYLIEKYDDQGGYYSGDRDYLYATKYRTSLNYWLIDKEDNSNQFTIGKLSVDADGKYMLSDYNDILDFTSHGLRRLHFKQDKNHIIIQHHPFLYQSRYKSVIAAPDSISSVFYNKKIDMAASSDASTSEVENYYYISRLDENGFSEKFATISRGKGARLIYFDKVSEYPLQYMLTTYREGTNHKIRSTIFDENGNIISDWDVFGDSPFGVSRAGGEVVPVDDKLLFLRGNQYVYGSSSGWSEVKKIFPEGASHLKYLTQYTNDEGQHVFIFSRKIIHENGIRYFFIYAASFDSGTGDFTIPNQLTSKIYAYSIYPWNILVSQNTSNALLEIGDEGRDFRYLYRIYVQE